MSTGPTPGPTPGPGLGLGLIETQRVVLDGPLRLAGGAVLRDVEVAGQRYPQVYGGGVPAQTWSALVRGAMQGSPPSSMFVIFEGWVKITATNYRGDNAPLAARGQGEIVGELSLALVLRLAVESARDLVHARYAALAVVDDEGDLVIDVETVEDGQVDTARAAVRVCPVAALRLE